MHTRTIGIESEAWASKPESGGHVPADIGPIAREFREMNGHAAFGHITREPGVGSIEYAAAPARSVREAVSNVRRLHEHTTAKGLNVLFNMRSPFAGVGYREPQVKKSRYGALWSAARLELEGLGLSTADLEERLSRMGYLNTHAATHAHLGFGPGAVTAEYIDPQVIFLLGALNLVGPRIARIYCRAYGIDNMGHLGITWAWADPKRFCRWGIWFRDFDDFRNQFSSLPRMMRPIGEPDPEFGDWEVDLQSSMQWGHPADWKTGYWPHVRPRSEFGTVEVRLLPSWPLRTLEEVVDGIVHFANFILDIAPKQPLGSVAEFQDSPLWKSLTSYHICGEKIPVDYDPQQWQDDVFR